MTVKFVNSTNKPMLSYYGGQEGEVIISNQMLFLKRGNEQIIRTSILEKIEQQENILLVTTANSLYTFEILQGDISELNMDFDLEKVEEIRKMNNTKNISYYCQITGHPIIEDAISVVTFKQPVTRNEAMQIISTTPTYDDQEGALIKNILTEYKNGN